MYTMKRDANSCIPYTIIILHTDTWTRTRVNVNAALLPNPVCKSGSPVIFPVCEIRSASRLDVPPPSWYNQEDLPQHLHGPDQALFGLNGPPRLVIRRKDRPGLEPLSTITPHLLCQTAVTSLPLNFKVKVKVKVDPKDAHVSMLFITG